MFSTNKILSLLSSPVWLMVKSSLYCSTSRHSLPGIHSSTLKQKDQNPADKSSKHWVPPRAWVMADASAHMTAASSADADEAEMPNVTFIECHITSGLDVTGWHYAWAWKGCSAGETWWRMFPQWQTCRCCIILIDMRKTEWLWMARVVQPSIKKRVWSLFCVCFLLGSLAVKCWDKALQLASLSQSSNNSLGTSEIPV